MPKNDPKTRNRVCCPNSQLIKKFNDYVSLPRNAKRNSGVKFPVGFESEFILLKNTNPIEPIKIHGSSTSIAQDFSSGTIEAQLLEEIAHALALADIELHHHYSEVASRQYEIVTGPLPP